MPASTSSAASTQPARAHLHRSMAVAEMVGGARERVGVLAPHFDQVLVGGGHAHDTAVIGPEAFAVAQHGAALEKQADFLATGDRRAQPASSAATRTGARARRRAARRRVELHLDDEHRSPTEFRSRFEAFTLERGSTAAPSAARSPARRSGALRRRALRTSPGRRRCAAGSRCSSCRACRSFACS